jgi:hypothetical protein
MALDKELNSSISQSRAFLFEGFAARLAGLTVDVFYYWLGRNEKNTDNCDRKLLR